MRTSSAPPAVEVGDPVAAGEAELAPVVRRDARDLERDPGRAAERPPSARPASRRRARPSRSRRGQLAEDLERDREVVRRVHEHGVDVVVAVPARDAAAVQPCTGPSSPGARCARARAPPGDSATCPLRRAARRGPAASRSASSGSVVSGLLDEDRHVLAAATRGSRRGGSRSARRPPRRRPRSDRRVGRRSRRRRQLRALAALRRARHRRHLAAERATGRAGIRAPAAAPDERDRGWRRRRAGVRRERIREPPVPPTPRSGSTCRTPGSGGVDRRAVHGPPGARARVLTAASPPGRPRYPRQVAVVLNCSATRSRRDADDVSGARIVRRPSTRHGGRLEPGVRGGEAPRVALLHQEAAPWSGGLPPLLEALAGPAGAGAAGSGACSETGASRTAPGCSWRDGAVTQLDPRTAPFAIERAEPNVVEGW